MLSKNKIIQRFLSCSLLVILAISTVQGQITQPTWWFGVSGATNSNFYTGTTQRLTNTLIVPTAFHKGSGVRPFASVLAEYRPAGIWGAMLNVGYDGRGGKFDGVTAPCDCPATLKTNMSYLSVEPSLRLGLGAGGFYLFAGPRVAFNMQKDFAYTQLRQPDTDAKLSEMRQTVISGQVGMGFDYQVSSPTSNTKVSISPFVSFHPYFGQDPRKIESLSVSTLRTGIAFKFGSAPKAPKPATAVPSGDVPFLVRGPKTVPVQRQVSETLPLRNAVFFDEGSAEIPNRYVLLTKNAATGFQEESLQNEQSAPLTGRSARQLHVYHHILNILGDRMRSNPGATISLSGASAQGPQDGKALAESVKKYLVTVFGIEGSRIATEGRTKPLIPSEQPGATRELALLRAGDRRVDISSTSPALLMEVGGGMMKPVQITTTQVDPLDSHVVFKVGSAKTAVSSWSLDIADENGAIQHYGPFKRNQESIPGKTILGDRPAGKYKVTMLTETKDGISVRKDSSIYLVSQQQTVGTALRYSILFDFDKAKTIEAYNKFLTDIVSPQITDGSTVIIHGHTDVIGEEEHNFTLSGNRAMQTQEILAGALAKAGRNKVTFETFGFG
jgi:outer membrane protein OmpA-like peptidoglycan-associated protein